MLSENNYQIVFLDTPGVIPNRNHAKMNRTLATSSWRSLDEADHGKNEKDVANKELVYSHLLSSAYCC